MLVRRAIPKKAVKPLIEHCNSFAARTGRSGAELFRCYLSWMKKYSDYVFSDPWPPKFVPTGELWLRPEEEKFVVSGRTYEEEVERFTVLMLKTHFTLEGFEASYFESAFDYYGRSFCSGCCVPDAMHLRWYVEKLEETNREFEEKARADPQDDYYRSLVESRTSPEAKRSEGMAKVKLGFVEKDAATGGKTCEVRNKYLCPYGAGSRRLIRLGGRVGFLWRIIEYYDEHWNRRKNSNVPRGREKWFHFDEAGILDVTSRQDIVKAVMDGRIGKIWDELVEYDKARK